MQQVRTRVGKYELGRILGEGAFSKVRFARNTETGQGVAIKVLDKYKVLQNKMIDQIKREISTMQLIKHPNVVQLHEVMASKTKIYIVLDFVTGGELFDKINDLGRLKEDEARRYFQQLINAVDYCHSRGVYHRDLKPENLLLDTFGNLKVSDFGLSALSRDIKSDGLLHTTCGTPNYVAPEVISGKGYDGTTADIWSCGVILFVLLAGYLPFDESNIIALYRKINKAEFNIPKRLSPGAKNLISRLLDPNSNTRITMAEILNDAWFKKGYKPPKFPKEDVIIDNIHAIFDDSEEYQVVEKKETQVVLGNAFELITMSQGLDLGTLFEKPMGIIKREKRFISKESPNNILSKIEEAVIPLGFSVQKQNHKMKLHCVKAGRKGNLAIATEVVEIAPSLVMVNFQKAAGDTLEFQEFYKNLTPGLQDVVWSSQANIEENKSV
ncbi:CBL-interacting serine/threonine-protein kinase 23 isoform X1 [Cryptomeria japonica]|uniref:CBL-interacting serine/threonine-protein kinase 23 isoform X1 n=1 Tax=Cryptomeria japonica TaxID=3369 RepID=UPI0025AC6108|nr:CBL-interacting serine/threonine-protein kinase 23 isoform X1 [Cryptomeria japonica]